MGGGGGGGGEVCYAMLITINKLRNVVTLILGGGYQDEVRDGRYSSSQRN